MTDAKQLYHQKILDLDEHPLNEGSLEHPTHRAKVSNPLCGDRVQIDLLLEDELLREIRFVGRGCAVSRASASILTERVRGLTAREAETLAEALDAWLKGGPSSPSLEGLEFLEGVRSFPSRLKCATLAWEAMTKALRSR